MNGEGTDPLLQRSRAVVAAHLCARGLRRRGGVLRVAARNRGWWRDTCVLELGSGGGNNASHLKSSFTMTLVDRSPSMLDVSRALNPECEHIEGDMRDVRLGRTFDAVFVHDAIDYMTTEADLRSAMQTAFAHCRVGGVAVFVPDHTTERFEEDADHGGHTGPDGRAVRYFFWTTLDAGSGLVRTDYVFLLRDAEGEVEVVHDRHHTGLFTTATWLRLLAEVGFEATPSRRSPSRIEHHASSSWARRPEPVALGEPGSAHCR